MMLSRNPTMIIDEDETMMEAMKVVLDKYSIQLEIFKNTADALQEIKVKRYDIVIVNFINEQDEEFVKNVREINPYTFFILLISNKGIGEQISMMRKYRNEAFFDKSTKFDNLLILIEGAYQRIMQQKEQRFCDEKIRLKGHEFAEIIRNAVDARDHYTRAHCDRVAELCELFCKQIQMPRKQRDIITKSAMFHDIGKIGVPDEILLKPGKLTDKEFAKIKLHPTIGENILQNSKTFEECLPIIKHHHERIDGKGYPDKLSGANIPYEARILSICDSFDAISAKRVYKPAQNIEDALSEIEKCKNAQFDATLADSFIKVCERNKEKIKTILYGNEQY